jgi:hypothetical protein
MPVNRSTVHARSFRRSLSTLGVMFLVAFSAQLILAGPAAAAPFTGGLSPTVIDGLLDLNGDDEVTGADDSNAFYGDTAIIDGGLDCDAWSGVNGGEAGDGVIDGNDDCQMLAYDGSPTGVTIEVVDGAVEWPDGAFPTVFPDPSDPDNPGVLEANFAWSTIAGLVDSSGDETIDANDCSFDVVGTADILGNTVGNTNPCGFANPPSASDNGKVDLNSDGDITAADTCEDGCFFGHNVTLGVVQVEGPSPDPTPSNAFSGTFGPTIINGGADLNGDGVVSGRDDSNAFFGETSIIDGQLDCNNWTTDNDGTAGDLAITNADDCTLIGYDGTANGVTINVIDGEFGWTGPLPTVFNATDPDNPGVLESDFAWSAIGGRVDSSGNEIINSADCHFGLIGETVDAGLNDATDGADILANNLAETNPCGFGVVGGPDPAFNGLVDLNSDMTITAADSCENCFFGLDLDNGFVVVNVPDTCPGFAGDPRNQVVGTSGADDLTGTAGADIICGLGGSDTLTGLGGKDLLLGGRGSDALRGGLGNDRLVGGSGRDRLVGASGKDRLFGGIGRDRLFGGPGRDLLHGGPGRDFGAGGPGRDTFRSIEIRRP